MCIYIYVYMERERERSIHKLNIYVVKEIVKKMRWTDAYACIISFR